MGDQQWHSYKDLEVEFPPRLNLGLILSAIGCVNDSHPAKGPGNSLSPKPGHTLNRPARHSSPPSANDLIPSLQVFGCHSFGFAPNLGS